MADTLHQFSLVCAVVGGTGSAFEVKIYSKEKVSALKKAIKAEKPNDLKDIDADNLQLFLAKTSDGTSWLPDDDDLDNMLQNKVDTSKMKKLRPSWQLNKPALFGPGVSLGEDVVHVFVVVPKQENDRSSAMDLGVASSLPRTTKHRHAERLKRWAAINEMIRQKNQEGNEKTSISDTNRKRKNRDVDSSMPYSSLSWSDLEPILPMEDLDLVASVVPDKVVEELRERLLLIGNLYGDIYSGKEAKRQVFIMAIIEAVCVMLGDATILVEEDVKGKNVHVHGRFEFVLKRGRKRISIVEAKRDDIPQGIAQNVAGLEALSDVEGLERTLGIVTNYLEWVFISDDDEKIRRINETLKIHGSTPSTEALREIVGLIHGLLMSST